MKGFWNALIVVALTFALVALIKAMSGAYPTHSEVVVITLLCAIFIKPRNV